MITVNEVGTAVFGAYRLACRDPGGMAYFDRTREGALKSFFGAVLLSPFYTFFVVSRWWGEPDILSPGLIVIVEILYYVIAWTAFPVLMIAITKWIDRGDKFYEYLVAINWANVLTMAVRFPVVVIDRVDLLPQPVVELMFFIVMTLVLIYLWFVTKTALDVGGGLAAALTAADFILSLLVSDVSTSIIKGSL